MLEVEHPPEERAVHADLAAYGAARAQRLHGGRAQTLAADFVVTLLKKRLFSSPAAFLRTLEVHRETLQRERPTPAPPPPDRAAAALRGRRAETLDEERAEDGVGDGTHARRSRPPRPPSRAARRAEELALLDAHDARGRSAPR